MQHRLSPEQAADSLAALPGWELRDETLCREFLFPGFADAMIFVNQVAELAEEEDHHPEIHIAYNKVALTLTTYGAGGLTIKDLQLALRIGQLTSGHPPSEDDFS
ncbi:MAG: 4a-hydroxytetrahydrobiopterin dehydratase [Acidobacteriota bacterium]|nr:4a-hydroxytetrahydrobiopterin dehydratase [Acidobacteriota bacterium]